MDVESALDVNPHIPVTTGIQCETRKPNRPRDTALLYAETRLDAWASWSRQHYDGLGYPKLSLIYKVLRRKARRTGAKPGYDDLTARGTETRSLRPRLVGEMPAAIAEVERAVNSLPEALHKVIMTEYFVSAPTIKLRARATTWSLDRYRQLLHAAKYSIYTALAALAPNAL